MENETLFRQKLVDAGQMICSAGLSRGSAGNISLLLPNGNILVTPTGSSLANLDPEHLSLVSPSNQLLSGEPPTKEVSMHLAYYQASSTIGAVIHVHSPYAVAVSCLVDLNMDDCLPPITPYFVMRIGRLSVIPYFPPGSRAIAENIKKRIAGHVATLLSNHGPVITGINIPAAINNSNELEDACRLHILLQGMKMRKLTEDEQNELYNKS